MPERVVFLDETAVKTNLTWLRGWAPRGERLTMDAPFGSWGRTLTLIAGLKHEALIALWVCGGGASLTQNSEICMSASCLRCSVEGN